MLKEFHNTTQDSNLVKNNQVICHRDLAPWNSVVFNGEPVAFIDFDGVEPGERVEDLAYLLWTFLDLGDENINLDKQLERITLLCKTYGYSDGIRLVENIIKEQEKVLLHRKNLSENSSNLELKEFSKNRIVLIERQIKWVKKNKKAIEISVIQD